MPQILRWKPTAHNAQAYFTYMNYICGDIWYLRRAIVNWGLKSCRQQSTYKDYILIGGFCEPSALDHYACVYVSVSLAYIHCEPKKNTQNCFCNTFYKSQSILIKFGTRCPEKMQYSSLNVFLLTWIMSLHCLVRLSVAFCKWIAIGTANQKITPNVFVTSSTKPGRFW